MIDVETDVPQSRTEKYLFDLIKKLSGRIYEEYGNTTVSTTSQTPDNPAIFTDVIYTQTEVGNGTILRGIGDKKDKIVVNTRDRRAWVERNVGVLEFDGSENWGEYNPEGAGQGLSFTLGIADSVAGANTSICTHFRYQLDAWGAWYIYTNGIYTDHRSTKDRYFRRPYAEIDTVQKFKDWLALKYAANDPVKLYYMLNETVIENIPFE